MNGLNKTRQTTKDSGTVLSGAGILLEKPLPLTMIPHAVETLPNGTIYLTYNLCAGNITVKKVVVHYSNISLQTLLKDVLFKNA